MSKSKHPIEIDQAKRTTDLLTQSIMYYLSSDQHAGKDILNRENDATLLINLSTKMTEITAQAEILGIKELEIHIKKLE